MNVRHFASLSSALLLLLESSSAQESTFSSIEDLNEEFGLGFTSLGEIYSDDIIFALVKDSIVTIQRVAYSDDMSVPDPMYGSYKRVGKEVKLERSLYSRLVNPKEVGGRILGATVKNAVVSIYPPGDKKLILWLYLPESKGEVGRVITSSGISEKLTDDLRTCLEQGDKLHEGAPE